MAGEYSDLPKGAVLEHDPVAATAPPAAAPVTEAPQPTFADLPEGATVESAPAAPADNGFGGLEPTRDKTQLLKNLRQLTSQKAPPDVLRAYAAASGATFPEETEKWLTDTYGKTPYETDFTPMERPTPGTGEAMWSGLQAGALGGFDDEWQAGWGAAGNKLGSLFGLNASTASLGDIYDAILQERRQNKDAAYADHPIAYGTGYVPGMLLQAFATRGRGAPAETLWGRLGQAALEGGKQGAISGAGNADSGWGNRIMGGVGGAALGALLGPALYPVGVGLGSIGGRIAGAVSPRTAASEATSGLDVLASRAPQNPAAMRAAQAEMQAAGVPPRLVDVVDESGRGVARDAASKMTPGRDVVARHADDVYTGMQDRVASQARTHISDSPVTARQAGDALTTVRDDAMEAGMAPIRNSPVELNPDMIAVMSTREGQAALRGAEGFMTDPAERAAVRSVMGAMREINRLDPRLPEPTRQQIQQQLLSDAGFTVDMADKFARAMKGAASKSPGLERVANQFSQTIRGAARDSSDDYARVLDDYADRSSVIDAARGTGQKFENTNFLNTPADEYASQVGNAGAIPPAGQQLSEAGALRVRARDDVVDRATSGAGQNAPGVARQLARGTAQNDRATTLLGEEGAGNLRRGMEGEVRRLDNTRTIDPRVGSKTHIAGQDAIVDGFADAVANTASGGKWSIIKTASSWLKKGGIRNVDAERLARDAVSEDPARLSAAIDYLEQKGMARARATRFIQTYGGALGGRVAGATQDDGVRAPAPHSVRALYKTPTKQGGSE